MKNGRIKKNIFNSLPDEFKDVRIDEKYLTGYLNKLKRKKFPNSPSTSAEIISALQKPEIKSSFGKNHVTTQESNKKGEYAFQILCDLDILEHVKNIPHREILMDATFDIVPQGPYKQFLVIYLAYEGNVI